MRLAVDSMDSTTPDFSNSLARSNSCGATPSDAKRSTSCRISRRAFSSASFPTAVEMPKRPVSL